MCTASARRRRNHARRAAASLVLLTLLAAANAAAVLDKPAQGVPSGADPAVRRHGQLALSAPPLRSRRLAQLLQILQQQQAEAEQAGLQAAEPPAEGAPPEGSAAKEEAGVEEEEAEEKEASGFLQAKPPPSKDNGIGGRVAQICISETVPIIACIGREESEFDGYEYTLFKRVAAEIGWGRGDYAFKCIEDYDGLLESLANNSGLCDVALGGMAVSQYNADQGIQLTSIPTIRSGYRVLVGAEVYRVSFFVFLDAFSWKLWLAIILTCVFVGVAIWLLDPWARSEHVPSRQDYRFLGLRQRVWSALANSMSFSATDMGESHAAGNIIVLAFAFMMLVLVSLYTAVTSSNLTANRLTSAITGVQDLPGKKVATWDDEEYLTDLGRRGVNATGLPWEEEADQIAMFDSVANGTFDALVLDSYVLEYGTNSRCDVTVVGDVFDQYEAGMAFPANYSHPELIERINAALLLLKESGDMEDLFRKYVNPPEPFCKRTMAAGQGTQIGFRDVVGLWVLLAGGVAFAVIFIAAARVATHSARRARPAIERAVTMVRRRSLSGPASPLGWGELGSGGEGGGDGGGAARPLAPGQRWEGSLELGAPPSAAVGRASADGGPSGGRRISFSWMGDSPNRGVARAGAGGAAAVTADAAVATGAAGHGAQLDALELEVLSALQRYRRAAMAVAAAGGAPPPHGTGAKE
ncbi:glutamate receptor [Raphidocelis subcapitata]|uniref:Glutamate receptor n=1 Tax=Raphidocelis subcapitata TaxID=307507 RepID=A0A2V0NXH5_9CHLO|nr:glutamate receptor [Raphidocelis subcapitata]|eukprot:GBF92326.1 glutamate receptor [Raphidocelis subcapitata]